jgi:hypothetical protein
MDLIGLQKYDSNRFRRDKAPFYSEWTAKSSVETYN